MAVMSSNVVQFPGKFISCDLFGLKDHLLGIFCVYVFFCTYLFYFFFVFSPNTSYPIKTYPASKVSFDLIEGLPQGVKLKGGGGHV